MRPPVSHEPQERSLAELCAELDYFAPVNEVVLRIEAAPDAASAVEYLQACRMPTTVEKPADLGSLGMRATHMCWAA